MTEFANIQRLGANYQMVAAASGSYTVVSTGSGANSSMIAASFKGASGRVHGYVLSA